MQEHTHRYRHSLCLVICRENDTFIKGLSLTSTLSILFLVNINLLSKDLPVSTNIVINCKNQSVDKDVSLADLRTARFVFDSQEDLDSTTAR